MKTFFMMEISKTHHKALRICKKGTKYCGWHREMPDFKQWRSACLVRPSQGVFTYHYTDLLTFRPMIISVTLTRCTLTGNRWSLAPGPGTTPRTRSDQVSRQILES